MENIIHVQLRQELFVQIDREVFVVAVKKEPGPTLSELKILCIGTGASPFLCRPGWCVEPELYKELRRCTQALVVEECVQDTVLVELGEYAPVLRAIESLVPSREIKAWLST